MIKLNLIPIFNARGIERPYTFLVKAGFTPYAANKLLDRRTRVIKLDHLEKLCLVLMCEPNDLFDWSPDKKEKIAGNHPLAKLKQDQSTVIDLQDSLSKMSLQELKSLSTKIKEEAK